jgi:hypothetical protein
MSNTFLDDFFEVEANESDLFSNNEIVKIET